MTTRQCCFKYPSGVQCKRPVTSEHEKAQFCDIHYDETKGKRKEYKDLCDTAEHAAKCTSVNFGNLRDDELKQRRGAYRTSEQKFAKCADSREAFRDEYIHSNCNDPKHDAQIHLMRGEARDCSDRISDIEEEMTRRGAEKAEKEKHFTGQTPVSSVKVSNVELSQVTPHNITTKAGKSGSPPGKSGSPPGRRSKRGSKDDDLSIIESMMSTAEVEDTPQLKLIKDILKLLKEHLNNLETLEDVIRAISTIDLIVSYSPTMRGGRKRLFAEQFKGMTRNLPSLSESSITNLLLDIDMRKLESILQQLKTYGYKLIMMDTLEDFGAMNANTDSYIRAKIKISPNETDLPDKIMDLLTETEGVPDPALLLRILIAKKISRSRALIFLSSENPQYQPIDIMRRILSDDDLELIYDTISSGEWESIYDDIDWDTYLI